MREATLDYLEEWAFVRRTGMHDHAKLCSYRQSNGVSLCDCDVLSDEHERRAVEQKRANLPARIGLCPEHAPEFYYPLKDGESDSCPACTLSMTVYEQVDKWRDLLADVLGDIGEDQRSAAIDAAWKALRP